MGNCRFIYQNYLTEATQINCNNIKSGFVTQALKDGAGSAVISVSGAYSGAVDKEYIVECDSTSSGAEVGQATIKYSTGGGAWNSSGVVSGAATLSNDVSIDFSSGAGADFVQGDRWYFKGINYFSPGKMIPWDRDNRFKSQNIDSTIVFNIDLGSSEVVNAIVIYDHNLTTAASIGLAANPTAMSTSTGTMELPALQSPVLNHANKIITFLSGATGYRYWRITFSDSGNPDGHIEISHLFIGRYFEAERNFTAGSAQPISYVTNSAQTPYGVKKTRYFNTGKSWSLEFPHMTSTDKTNLEETLIPALVDKDDGTKNPFYICLDSTNSTETYMVEMEGINRRQNAFNYSYSLGLTEVLKSV